MPRPAKRGVYADPKSGYTYGLFPKPWVKIAKQYDCPSPRIDTDSTKKDTSFMQIDSAKARPDSIK